MVFPPSLLKLISVLIEIEYKRDLFASSLVLSPLLPSPTQMNSLSRVFAPLSLTPASPRLTQTPLKAFLTLIPGRQLKYWLAPNQCNWEFVYGIQTPPRDMKTAAEREEITEWQIVSGPSGSKWCLRARKGAVSGILLALIRSPIVDVMLGRV